MAEHGLSEREFRQHANWCRQLWWDQAANAWNEKESGGLNVTHLQEFASFFRDPVLVVGAGQGMLSEFLIRSGFDVSSIDWSKPMINRAWLRRQIRVQHAFADRLPFADFTFGAVIISSGVLSDSHSDSELAACLHEAARATRADGIVIAAILTDETNEASYYDSPMDLAPPASFRDGSRIRDSAFPDLDVCRILTDHCVRVIAFRKSKEPGTC